MSNKAPWHSYFLAVNGIAINLALFYSFIATDFGNRSVSNFQFPQFFHTRQIVARQMNVEYPNSTSAIERVRDKQVYNFTLDNHGIDLEISYLVGARSDVEQYLKNYTKLPERTIEQHQIRQQAGIGYHMLLADRERAYLSSCISPRSLSSVTPQQFSQQRYQNDLNFKIAWNWLQGKASIRDRRCLWVLLSTPTDSLNTQAAYRTLEIAWKEIYPWWLANFPSLTSKNSN